MDFHDLDFVGAPAALGPSKSGVGCLDCVGQKKSSSNAMFLVLSIQAVLVFPRNVPTKSEAPTPPGQFSGVYFTSLFADGPSFRAHRLPRRMLNCNSI